MSDGSSSFSSESSSVISSDMSDQGANIYTVEELYKIFPQFLRKDDTELFEYLKLGPEIPDDPLLVCTWVDAELETAGANVLPTGTTLEQKKTAIGASLVLNGAERVGTSGTAFFFRTRDEMYTARRNMLNSGAPNNVAWAFNFSIDTATNGGGNIVATNPRVNSVIIASIADITTTRHRATYQADLTFNFFEI